MNTKMIYLVDSLLVVGTLAVLVFAFMYAKPTLSSPVNGFVTSNPVLFSFDKGDAILIDDNSDFTTPQRFEVRDDVRISLEPGVYYWKVEGVVSSEIRQLTVESIVDLRVRKAGEGYELVNGGTTRLNVDVYDHGVLTGNIILDKEASESARGDSFVGREDA